MDKLKSWLIRYRLKAPPADEYIVVCGIPRSGTTLLYQMIRYCCKNVYTFNHEVGAFEPELLTFQPSLGDYPVCCKRPRDIFLVDSVRRALPVRAFLCTWRDPRQTIASKLEDKHWVSSELYLECFGRIQQQCAHDDFFVISFDDLLTKPDEVEKLVCKRTGLEAVRPFSRYYEGKVNGDFPFTPVGPLSKEPLTRWRDDQVIYKHVCHELNRVPLLNDAVRIYESGDPLGFRGS